MVEAKQPTPPPPRAPGLPLIGSALAIAADPLRFLLEQRERLGPIFRLRAAHLRLVVMAGEEANAFVHGEGADCFSNRETWAPTLAEFGAPNNFVGLDGEAHRLLRKRFAQQFSRRAAESGIDTLCDLTLDAFSGLRPGEAIPFVRFNQALVSRQVGSLLCGRVPSAAEHEAILRYTNAVVVGLSLRRLPPWTLKLRGPGFARDRRTAFEFARKLVDEHATPPQQESQDESFIDAVRNAAREQPELFGEGDILSAGLLPFFAGVDTVGQTNVFILYELLRHPDLLERVRAEIDPLFESGRLEPAALREAVDLHGAVNEALRLHPVAFAMPRTATRDFDFAGHRVASGDSMLVFTTACHFDENYFPDPERFDIDRYRPPRDEHRQPNAFAPFGRGPHFCLGAGFAGVQMAATVATMLHHFDLELAEPGRAYPHVLRPSLSLGPAFAIRYMGPRRVRRAA